MHPPTRTAHVRAPLSTNLFVGFTWEPFSWYSAINWRFSYTVSGYYIKGPERVLAHLKLILNSGL